MQSEDEFEKSLPIWLQTPMLEGPLAFTPEVLKHWGHANTIIHSIPCNSGLSSMNGGIPRLSSRTSCHEHMKRLMFLNSMLYQTRSLRTTYMLFIIRSSILHSGFVMLCWTLTVSVMT